MIVRLRSHPPAFALGRRELLCLAGLFLLTLPAVTPRLYASDEVQYFSYLRSLWFDGDVSFDNEYRHFYDGGVARTDGFRETFLVPLTPTGKRENFGTIGSAILWAPFYAAADVIVRVRRAAGSAVEADGYSRPYLVAVAWGSAVYAFAGLLLSMAAARRLTGHGLVAGLAVWFGTPLLFYMYAAPPFAHACSAFAVAVFVTIWLHVRQRWSPGGMIALGAWGALMAMVREQDVFYGVGPAVDWLIAMRGRRENGRALVIPPLAGAAAFLLAYLPQILAYVALNGRPGPSGLVTRKMSWTSPHALEVLGSPNHGLFVWTPLALMAVAGLAVWCAGGLRGAHGAPALTADPHPTAGDAADLRLRLCLLAVFLLQVYISGSVESWTVAGAFGQRRFVGATILLVIGLSALWRLARRGVPRVALGIAAAVCVWWNVGLMALFGAGLMDRQRVEPRRNAYDVFITLPAAAPDLAYRYLFDRASFYKSPDAH